MNQLKICIYIVQLNSYMFQGLRPIHPVEKLDVIFWQQSTDFAFKRSNPSIKAFIRLGKRFKFHGS